MKENTDIPIIKIMAPLPGRHVVLLAGVHGDEYEPMLAAWELSTLLPDLLTAGAVTIVPVANADAYHVGSRFGEDGLDLARICPGNPEGTISEQTSHRISSVIRTGDYLVDMHTGGVMFDIWPLAGYMLHPSKEILEKQREMAFAFNLLVVWGTDHHPDGRTLSVARDAGIPAIYLEFGGGTGVRPHVITAYVKGFVNLLKYLALAEGPVQTLPEEDRYWVEDYRRDSGYLQGNMPSPTDGIFISEVSVGAQLTRGQRWGKVVDPVSGESTEVDTEIDGLAFMVRNLVKVKQGDSLGGVLPIGQPGRIIIRTGVDETVGRQLTPTETHADDLPPVLKGKMTQFPSVETYGKVVIITGAAGGIGSASARVFAGKGYAVVLADIDGEALAPLESELVASGCAALAFPGNLETEAYWTELVSFAIQKFGSIDIVVNNAAWRVAGSLRSQTLEQWEKTLRICLTVPVFLSKLVAAEMERRGSGGVIVNVSSVMADRPSGLGAAYMATKGALDTLTRELAITYGRQGIRVVGIAPGYIDTPMSNDYTDDVGENISRKLIGQLVDFIPLGRGGQGSEVAEAIAWLCSGAASYITGTTVTIDGGFKPNFNPYSIKKLQFPDEF